MPASAPAPTTEVPEVTPNAPTDPAPGSSQGQYALVLLYPIFRSMLFHHSSVGESLTFQHYRWIDDSPLNNPVPCCCHFPVHA